MERASIDPPAADAGYEKASVFEKLLKCAPVCESLLLQIPTDSILALYHTCRSLRHFLRTYPTSWKYLSYRLYQPNAPQVSHHTANARPTSNYALDQLLIYVINPFSTCLTSLELDNTAVSGLVLYQTVLALRRETLEHLSVRGCKNVSLKYHINPWLNMYCLVSDLQDGKHAPSEYRSLALKSLYTYRCRHHRRRPYLPSSLQRKDSDSEPTHELVNLCHRLGIWTDTAWCTTPAGRCFRRRGYSTMRGPQDHREVWVVFDRLWRSRNWLGPTDSTSHTNKSMSRKRKRDCRPWELEEASRGEALGADSEGKGRPAHLRRSHRNFVENITCDNCSAVILERCEQCSITMHCSGCRKTLCASCAFDRSYSRNAKVTEDDANKFWWAPGCIVSPCSMQDQDPGPVTPGANLGLPTAPTGHPVLQFKWCCVEPVFSGGGGISFTPGTHGTDMIRAAPISRGLGWEDAEFCSDLPDSTPALGGPGGRWDSIDGVFKRDDLVNEESSSWHVPRNLCDECYDAEKWRFRCKACSTPICLKHDLRDKLRARLCGYKDLSIEKAEFKARQRSQHRTGKMKEIPTSTTVGQDKAVTSEPVEAYASAHGALMSCESFNAPAPAPATPEQPIAWLRADSHAAVATPLTVNTSAIRSPISDDDLPGRPNTPGSNSTAAPSRASTPTPSETSTADSVIGTSTDGISGKDGDSPPNWRGCQSFFCTLMRTPGDHRRRCTAVFRQCLDCKVNVCGECSTLLEPGCSCLGCRQILRNDATSSSMPLDAVPFLCPNCRWKRRQSGACKRRLPNVGRMRRKKKPRKPFHERLTSRGPAPASAYDDNAVEMTRDFLETFMIAEGESTMTLAVRDNDVISVDEEMEEIQELEDMGTLARDLISRIQRLRAQIRPNYSAALTAMTPSVLPEIRIEAIIAEAGSAGGHPVVEEMD